MQLVSNGICMVLAGRNWTTFPRHRWTRADISTDEVGLCFAIHNLLSDVYPLFCKAMSKDISSKAAERPSGIVHLPLLDDAGEHQGHQSHDSAAQADAGDIGGEPKTVTQRQIENSQHRQKALDWVQSKPFGKINSIQNLGRANGGLSECFIGSVRSRSKNIS